MAYIKVDHVQFEKTARAVENYAEKRTRSMNAIDRTVVTLGAAWQGEDYRQFAKEWQGMNAENAVSAKAVKALLDYAESLRDAGTKYREAQMRAINRANALCK